MAPLPSFELDFSAAPDGPPSTAWGAADLLQQQAMAAEDGGSTAAELRRLLLASLVSERAVVELPGGGFGLRSVAIQQLGETLLGLLEHARADVATAYKTPGLSLRHLCDQLVSTGLAERRAVGKTIHLLPRPHWLQPYVRAARSASPPRRAMPARPQPQAAPGPRAAGAGAANTAPRRAAGGAEGAVEVVLHPLPSSKKGGISRGNAVMLLSVAAYRLIAGSPPAMHVQHFAIRSLLHLGIEKVEQFRFRQRPVGLQEARLKLDEVLAAKGNDVAKAFRSQFFGSLLEVLDSPAVAGLVRICSPPPATSDAQHDQASQSQGQVQLLLGPLCSHLPAGCRAEAVPPSSQAAGPSQARLTPLAGSEGNGTGGCLFSGDNNAAPGRDAAAVRPPAEQEASSAAPAPAVQPLERAVPARQLSVAPVPPPPVQLPAGQPPAEAQHEPGQLRATVITTEQAAASAVAALLAAPCVALSCELQQDGTLGMLACMPASSSTDGAGGVAPAAVIHLAGMSPEARQAAVPHLARLLESPDIVKLTHDCRAASEALFHGHGIQLGPVWDTQAAFGLVQHLALLGTAEAEGGVDPPTSLDDLCNLYSLPCGTAAAAARLAARPADNPGLLSRANLDPAALKHAAASVAPLCALRERLTADLGPVAAQRVPDLSRAFSRWNLELAAFASAHRPPRQWVQQLLELAPLAV